MSRNYGGKGKVKTLPTVVPTNKTKSAAMPGPKSAGKLGHVGSGKLGIGSAKTEKAKQAVIKDGCP